MDQRFDRLYILKIESGEQPRLERLLADYHIPHNNVFDGLKDFHIIFGLCSAGLLCLSHVMALRGIDFNGLDELKSYLDTFEDKN